jgi:uncharacterized membrane protein YgcG
MVLPASALSLLLLLTQCCGRALASTPTSACDALYNTSGTYFGYNSACDFAGDGNDDDFIAWIDYGCEKEDGGKNISVASNVHCTGYLDRGEDFDTTWTCAAFETDFDFTKFLQEVEASAIFCASGMPPMFTYTSVYQVENQDVCANKSTTYSKTGIPTWTTSVEFDETMTQMTSFYVLREDLHEGCSNDGGDENAPSGGSTPISSGGVGTPGSSGGGGTSNTASSNAPTTTMTIGGFVPWMLCIVVFSANIMGLSF